jgi:arylsulfatase A-like enzyme
MNVVVIITDSLRLDHVGCYGSDVKTPNIDSLAKEGTIFENAFSEGLPTLPTRTTWWTGRYTFPLRGWQQFNHSDLLLAEVLWDKGIKSALISDTYHMHKPVYNCGRGFDTVVWVRGQEYDPWIVDPSVHVDITKWHRLKGDETDELWKPRFEQYLRNVSWIEKEEDYFVARVITEAIKWIENMVLDKKQKDKLFLWVDCFDPHEPWDPPEPYRSMYDPHYNGQEIIDPVAGDVDGYMTSEEINHTKALYAGEVTLCDKWIGLLLEKLRELELYDNTLIMHTTDHGEPLGEHGYIRKAKPNNYEHLVHIPWIIKHPSGIGSGKRIREIVQTVDLMPTILDFLDISTEKLELPFLAPTKKLFPQDIKISSKRAILHGYSLFPLMNEEVRKIRDYAYMGYYGRQWTIRNHEWSYHLPIDGSKPPELYNMKKDPEEHENLLDERKDIAKELELNLRTFVDDLTLLELGVQIS